MLQALATVTREAGTPGRRRTTTSQPVIDIYGAVQGRDLGSVAREINPILAASEKELPRGSQLIVRGQIETMTSSFIGLLAGLALAIVPRLPADRRELPVVAGSVHHHLGAAGGAGRHRLVPVPVAHDVQRAVADRRDHVHGRRDRQQHPGGQFREGRARGRRDAVDAAIDAGFTRFRPVLMTALAMIIGMVPMALGFGEGGEQNAPLGRAVIGGLAFATVATLFFVPVGVRVAPRNEGARTGRAPTPAAEISH